MHATLAARNEPGGVSAADERAAGAPPAHGSHEAGALRTFKTMEGLERCQHTAFEAPKRLATAHSLTTWQSSYARTSTTRQRARRTTTRSPARTPRRSPDEGG